METQTAMILWQNNTIVNHLLGNKNPNIAKLFNTLADPVISRRERRLASLFKDIFENRTPYFYQIQVETCSFCNGSCEFCPAGNPFDPRGKHFMSEDIVESLLSRLKEIDFQGLVSLFNNNEPFLDGRLAWLVSRFKHELPDARIEIYTNGLLLDLESAARLWRAGLDSLVIEYFAGKRAQNKKVRNFLTGYERSPFWNSKHVMINRIDPSIVRSNRCGRAPNKQAKIQSVAAFCPLPFMQFNVNFRGDVHLCCNDVYYEDVMGNITISDIKDIWNSAKYADLRKRLLAFDRNMGICSRCDARMLMKNVKRVLLLAKNNQLLMPEHISNGATFPWTLARRIWRV